MLAVQHSEEFSKDNIAFPARLSQNLRKLSSRRLAKPEDALDSSMKWIMEHHDAWTRITLHCYYEKTCCPEYTQEHLQKCMLDRLGILGALLTGCSKIAAVVESFCGFKCVDVVRQEYGWLRDRCIQMGLETETPQLSYPAALIVNYVEMTTMPGAELCSAVSAIWAFMMTSWIGWNRALGRVGSGMCPEYCQLAASMSVPDAMQYLLEAGELLDRCLKRADKKEVFNAQKTFEEMLKLISSFLDEATLTENDMEFLYCLDCGRKGHSNSECAFRSHV
eukprot:Plantae.Rhodophyta-Rhodochaete_pulchella.ctg37707.p1 GENE.Plantae.Rhodophyta-Rhodochaete_pulchella.ctg37707~~Plantae.Rhodophyta-Rhodochaete_pulchella.ctg37707.p1  ORF type:complete len:278 (+),score=50.15 Plantae.Rhodophyta-Rhodochaete_pulchella.ctg37707:101-934(+)